MTLENERQKCCCTIFSNGGRDGMEFDLIFNSESIPYNPNPVFLGHFIRRKIEF